MHYEVTLDIANRTFKLKGVIDVYDFVDTEGVTFANGAGLFIKNNFNRYTVTI